jgi:hypothetical protein
MCRESKHVTEERVDRTALSEYHQKDAFMQMSMDCYSAYSWKKTQSFKGESYYGGKSKD